MSGVLIGFSIIGVIIAMGYVLARSGAVGPESSVVLSTVAFFVTTPALLFTVLTRADLSALFSSFFLASLSAVAVIAALSLALSVLLLHRPVAETAVASAAAWYVNANNIGLPVAIYVLGDPQWVAPTLLMQHLILVPALLTTLDVSARGRASLRSILTRPLRNPMIIASALGITVALTGVEVPAPVLQPFEIVGSASVPLVLLAFGVSLRGQRPLRAGSARRDVIVASILKSLVMPVCAWALGRFVFALDAEQLLAVTVIAALPTAQNVFTIASRYERGAVLARDTALLTTIAAVPVLVLVALLLG